jgi:hypothetical protein
VVFDLNRRPSSETRQWWESLSGEQRFSLSVFGICGMLTLVLSVAYLRAGLTSPFLVPNSALEASREVFKRHEENARQLEILQQTDTDQDGLSDYAEIYLYKTSPYLADTDSDGVTDAIEIAQGENPNCPRGENCLVLVDSQQGGISTSTFEGFLQTSEVPTAEEILLGATDPSVVGAQGFLANPPEPSSMTVEQTRAYLINNNLASEEAIAQLSDQSVQQVYLAAYNQAQQIKHAQEQAAAIREGNDTGGETPN